MAKGIVIAAPNSGSGKTLVTLGLLRALKKRGVKVVSAKAGPDYIDPGFHAAATGHPCINLDLWAMGETAVRALASAHAADADLLVIEGVMGLFDGPQGAKGSTADLAAALGLPVVLVVDAARQGQSIAALAHGFRSLRSDVHIIGVLLNRISSDKHEYMLKSALHDIHMPVTGTMRQIDSLHLPSRHLGLMQAQENQELEAFIEDAASGVARETFLDSFFESAASLETLDSNPQILPPLAQSIAIARDVAFSFIYPHVLDAWKKAGAELSFFSPLADQPPDPNAGAVFLPGGYPELHAGKLAANTRFLAGLKSFKGLTYGECGGYMVLGDGLIDKDGARHAMAGLLPVTTSFAKRKLHLGYRQLTSFSGPWPQARGHEFHYSTLESEGQAPALFAASDAAGNDLGVMGHKLGNVMGSYAHVISVAHHG